ncbi:MAG: hypothetical protein AAF716_10805 [Cyanobacteria bacterium P01_D01_bin.1]
MPTDSYHDSHIQKLLDPQYSSLYMETCLEETIKDGNIRAFRRALDNVLEAAEKRTEAVSAVYLARQRVYRELSDCEELTIDLAMSALEAVGIVPQLEPVEVQLTPT